MILPTALNIKNVSPIFFEREEEEEEGYIN